MIGRCKAFPWPEAARDRLASLAPHHTASQIARIMTGELGVSITRSAVIGKLHRMNVPLTRAAELPPVRRETPPDVVMKIREMAANGTPRRQICRLLGIRHARVVEVIGKVTAGEIAARRARPAVAERNRKAAAPKDGAPVADDQAPTEAIELSFGAVAGSQPCSLLDLKLTSCRWPIGDVRFSGVMFCGAPQSAGSSYCACHRARAVAPTPGRIGQIRWNWNGKPKRAA